MCSFPLILPCIIPAMKLSPNLYALAVDNISHSHHTGRGSCYDTTLHGNEVA